jgi:Rieske Fe-S protein
MQRREFCARACQATPLIAIASLLEGCSNSPTSPSGGGSSLSTVNGTPVGGGVSVTIDAASPLASAGGLALVQSARGSFLVARAAGDVFNVFTAICTHEGCTITNFSGDRFACPCHGSQYSTSAGTVLQGPAQRALQRFTASFANGVLTIAA